MLLPNHAEATIAVGKTRDYLLNLEHVEGGPKAAILYRIGFRRERWGELEVAIREQIATYDAQESPGYPEKRFVVRGPIHGPEGSHAFRTIWMLDASAVAPRFVSAYPR